VRSLPQFRICTPSRRRGPRTTAAACGPPGQMPRGTRRAALRTEGAKPWPVRSEGPGAMTQLRGSFVGKRPSRWTARQGFEAFMAGRSGPGYGGDDGWRSPGAPDSFQGCGPVKRPGRIRSTPGAESRAEALGRWAARRRRKRSMTASKSTAHRRTRARRTPGPRRQRRAARAQRAWRVRTVIRQPPEEIPLHQGHLRPRRPRGRADQPSCAAPTTTRLSRGWRGFFSCGWTREQTRWFVQGSSVRRHRALAVQAPVGKRVMAAPHAPAFPNLAILRTVQASPPGVPSSDAFPGLLLASYIAMSGGSSAGEDGLGVG
jgi:hypothetical protein